MINTVICSGKIGCDLIYNKTPKGDSYAFLKIAVPKRYLGIENRNTHVLVQVNCYGKVADNAFEYAVKGDFCEVVGHIDLDRKRGIMLVADSIRFVSGSRREPADKLGGEEFKGVDDFE